MLGATPKAPSKHVLDNTSDVCCLMKHRLIHPKPVGTKTRSVNFTITSEIILNEFDKLTNNATQQANKLSLDHFKNQHWNLTHPAC